MSKVGDILLNHDRNEERIAFGMLSHSIKPVDSLYFRLVVCMTTAGMCVRVPERLPLGLANHHLKWWIWELCRYPSLPWFWSSAVEDHWYRFVLVKQALQCWMAWQQSMLCCKGKCERNVGDCVHCFSRSNSYCVGWFVCASVSRKRKGKEWNGDTTNAISYTFCCWVFVLLLLGDSRNP